MKRSFVFMLISIFILVSFIIVGCGGKSKKISEVSQEEEEVLEEGAEAKKEELPTTYVVKEGDKLWTIAEKPEIYGNKWQWPLIYDANRDILESYDSLEPGQTLIIPRNVSAVEIEAAKERAMELGIPPKEKEEEVEESVVGLGEGTKSEESTTSSEEEYTTEGTSEAMGESAGEAESEDLLEEEPTPIPEPVKPKKKGGINLLLIIILILLIAGGVVIYIFIKQKKEEEEEDIISKKDDDEDAGILT